MSYLILCKKEKFKRLSCYYNMHIVLKFDSMHGYCTLKKTKLKITQLEKMHFIKVKELKLTEGELL